MQRRWHAHTDEHTQTHAQTHTQTRKSAFAGAIARTCSWSIVGICLAIRHRRIVAFAKMYACASACASSHPLPTQHEVHLSTLRSNEPDRA
eukprot:6196248-Pleurochrysis_carterae.AAC.2